MSSALKTVLDMFEVYQKQREEISENIIKEYEECVKNLSDHDLAQELAQ